MLRRVRIGLKSNHLQGSESRSEPMKLSVDTVGVTGIKCQKFPKGLKSMHYAFPRKKQSCTWI